MEGFLKPSGPQTIFHLRDVSDIVAARRAGADLAHRLQLDAQLATDVAAIITEAATNIVKHALHGELIIRAVATKTRVGIEVLAIDAGPGLNPTAAHAGAAHAHYGAGLLQISQLAHDFDGYTAPGKGTVLWMQVWATADVSVEPAWDIGVICLPVPSEEACGDAWYATETVYGLSVMVADGIGHGVDAAFASDAAVDILRQRADLSPTEAIQLAHRTLHGTRGAAVAIANIDLLAHQIDFAGIGNIAARIMTNDVSRHLMSHNGIVGSNLRKVEQLTFPWADESTLVMQSDGIGTRWNITDYPGLIDRHPAVMAAVLFRDYLRPRDDATVIVVRRCRVH